MEKRCERLYKNERKIFTLLIFVTIISISMFELLELLVFVNLKNKMQFIYHSFGYKIFGTK